MTEQEQIELLAWNEYHFGPDWASDEFELRQRAAELVEYAFSNFDGRNTKAVEVMTLSALRGCVGELQTMPVSPDRFNTRVLHLFAGLKREEAQLIAEEFLRE